MVTFAATHRDFRRPVGPASPATATPSPEKRVEKCEVSRGVCSNKCGKTPPGKPVASDVQDAEVYPKHSTVRFHENLSRWHPRFRHDRQGACLRLCDPAVLLRSAAACGPDYARRHQPGGNGRKGPAAGGGRRGRDRFPRGDREPRHRHRPRLHAQRPPLRGPALGDRPAKTHLLRQAPGGHVGRSPAGRRRAGRAIAARRR